MREVSKFDSEESGWLRVGKDFLVVVVVVVAVALVGDSKTRPPA
jgi:hypothetical protein